MAETPTCTPSPWDTGNRPSSSESYSVGGTLRPTHSYRSTPAIDPEDTSRVSEGSIPGGRQLGHLMEHSRLAAADWNEVDPDLWKEPIKEDSSKTHITTYVAWKIQQYTSMDLVDQDLLDAFQEDFAGLDKNHFLTLDDMFRKELKAILREGGVWPGKNRGATFTHLFHLSTVDELPTWPPKEAEGMDSHPKSCMYTRGKMQRKLEARRLAPRPPSAALRASSTAPQASSTAPRASSTAAQASSNAPRAPSVAPHTSSTAQHIAPFPVSVHRTSITRLSQQAANMSIAEEDAVQDRTRQHNYPSGLFTVLQCEVTLVAGMGEALVFCISVALQKSNWSNMYHSRPCSYSGIQE